MMQFITLAKIFEQMSKKHTRKYHFFFSKYTIFQYLVKNIFFTLEKIGTQVFLDTYAINN